MRWKKTDIETKAKIIEAKVWNPDLSTRDIEEITWADHSTISRVLDKDLQQLATESERLARIIDNDLESIENMSEITKRFTKEIKAKEELERADIDTANRTTESAFKRSQLLQGRATEKFDFTSLDESQAQLIASRYMSER